MIGGRWRTREDSPRDQRHIIKAQARAHTHREREKVALLFIAMIDIKQLS